jgi:hypothetical protein
MKRLTLIFTAALAISGCATTQSTQTTYVEACAAYGAAFNVALQLRVAGKMNQSQVDQVTLIDQQITPICTGPLPADPTAATTQITAAVTTLTMMEAIKKARK